MLISRCGIVSKPSSAAVDRLQLLLRRPRRRLPALAARALLCTASVVAKDGLAPLAVLLERARRRTRIIRSACRHRREMHFLQCMYVSFEPEDLG